MALLFQLTQKLAHGFQAFWDRYPRREAKKDATKAWQQVKPTTETEEAIHAALDWQLPLWEDREKKFIPLPATYLRGERWTDEPPTPPKPPTPSRTIDQLPEWQRRSIEIATQRREE
jgi:hypothetical protein